MKILLTDHSYFSDFEQALVKLIAEVNPNLWQQRERAFITELYSKASPTMLADKLLEEEFLEALASYAKKDLSSPVVKFLKEHEAGGEELLATATKTLKLKALVERYPQLLLKEVLESSYYQELFKKLAKMHKKAWQEDVLVNQLPSTLMQKEGPYSTLNTIYWARDSQQSLEEEEVNLDHYSLHTRKDEWLLFLDRYAFLPDFFIERLLDFQNFKINLDVINLALVEGNQLLVDLCSSFIAKEDNKAAHINYQELLPSALEVKQHLTQQDSKKVFSFTKIKGWKEFNQEINEILLVIFRLLEQQEGVCLEQLDYFFTFLKPQLKEHPSFSPHYQGFYSKDKLLGLYQKHNRYNDKLRSTFFVRRESSYFASNAFVVRASALATVSQYQELLISNLWFKELLNNKEFDVGYLKDPWAYSPQSLPTQPFKVEKSYFANKVDNLLLSFHCYFRQLKLTTSLDSNDD